MATIQVLYDPDDRLQMGPPKGAEHAFRNIKFASMRCDGLDDPENISSIAGELAEMLLEQIAK